jgi:hypothetical protein
MCQHYTGCPAEIDAKYPLVFCTLPGQIRGVFDFYTAAVAAFSAQLDAKPK